VVSRVASSGTKVYGETVTGFTPEDMRAELVCAMQRVAHSKNGNNLSIT
jgi:hypothetical protein